jgi:hypothetical protein
MPCTCNTRILHYNDLVSLIAYHLLYVYDWFELPLARENVFSPCDHVDRGLREKTVMSIVLVM